MEDGGGVSATDRVGSPSPLVDHKAGHPGEMSFVSSNESPTVFQRGGGNQHVSVANGVTVSSTVSPKIGRTIEYRLRSTRTRDFWQKTRKRSSRRRIRHLVPTQKFKSADVGECKVLMLLKIRCGTLPNHRIALLQNLRNGIGVENGRVHTTSECRV